VRDGWPVALCGNRVFVAVPALLVVILVKAGTQAANRTLTLLVSTAVTDGPARMCR
jgi:hypothetical protein